MAMDGLPEHVARACRNCAIAKAKCDWVGVREGGRCHRYSLTQSINFFLGLTSA